MIRIIDEARSFIGIMISPIKPVAAKIAMPAFQADRRELIDPTDVASTPSASFDYCRE